MQIKLIALGKSAGFSLEKIVGMFGGNSAYELPRNVLHKTRDEIDRQILELIAL